MKPYNHERIERKWQKTWEKNKLYVTKDSATTKKSSTATKGSMLKKKNEFLLVEFPYPSGDLHVGHWYAFSMPDILARMHRMQGKNVLFPIGFDAFGLPAENAAIKRNINPRQWTYKNIAHMRKQITSMGASFDWSREVVTCDPEYYKWTQWLFLELYKKGLVYRKPTLANWCPKDKTVLANEQVVSGTCERCGTEVIQKEMPQWNIRITDYADRLIDDLDGLDWPEPIKEAQRNWIGRSEGALIPFSLSIENDTQSYTVEVFTTRADTIFGATYIVLAPEHSFVQKYCEQFTNATEVAAYIRSTKKKTDLERQESKEKTGVVLSGVTAINPATKKAIPVYIADYVLGHYGTGAVMAVPAHDERDFAFAKKYNLPIEYVVEPVLTRTTGKDAIRPGVSWKDRNAVMCIVKHWQNDEYLCLEWNEFPDIKTFVSGGIEPGESPEKAGKREIAEETGYTNAKFISTIGGPHFSKFFHQQKNININARFTYLYFELTDGAQSKISETEKKLHSVKWIPQNEVSEFVTIMEKEVVWNTFTKGEKPYTGDGILGNSGTFTGQKSDEARAAIMTAVGGKKKTTYRLRDWIVSRQRYWGAPIPMIHCDECGILPVKTSDLPVLLPRINNYLPGENGTSPLSHATRWVKTKCPKCKKTATRETDTLDTFVCSSWYFLRYTDPKNKKAFASPKMLDAWLPVDLYSGGAEHTTMHLLYSRFWYKALADCKLVKGKEPYTRRLNRGLIMGPDGQKMSKSKGNVIDPDELVKKLGADTMRLYLAFIGPYNEVGSYPWNHDSISGVRRFLERVWKLQYALSDTSNSDLSESERMLHATIKKCSEAMPELKFNVCIAQMMSFLNVVEKEGISRTQFEIFILILAPFVPHIAEELWHNAGHKSSVHLEKWPTYNPKKLIADAVDMPVQINGKVRGSVRVAVDAQEAEIVTDAHASVQKWITGKHIIKTIVVPGRIVNIVISE